MDNKDQIKDEKVMLASSAIELLHTESVIHDDIIDKENFRRGKPSFHVKYGYNSSILTADFVLGYHSQYVLKDKQSKCIC